MIRKSYSAWTRVRAAEPAVAYRQIAAITKRRTLSRSASSRSSLAWLASEAARSIAAAPTENLLRIWVPDTADRKAYGGLQLMLSKVPTGVGNLKRQGRDA